MMLGKKLHLVCRNKIYRVMAAMFICLPMFANAATDSAAYGPLRLGTRLSLNSVGEITDAPWGVYADGVGYGATLSFDVSYRLSERFALHSAVGLDFRYFATAEQEIGIYCDGDCGGQWKGKDKDDLLYIDVPILVQFQIPEIVYFEAGPVFDFLLVRHSEFFVLKEYRQDKCQNDRVFGAGVSFGAGHTFSFGLFVDVRISYQFTDVVSINEKCGSYTVREMRSHDDAPTGTEHSEKMNEYIDKNMVGSYYWMNKIQLGVGYWF